GRTLVAVLTEFGRNPRIGQRVAASSKPDGRDHWSKCFSILLAGGGIRGGQVCGRSDARGEYAVDQPQAPADVAATVLHALGIDPGTTVTDGQERPHMLCAGTPIRQLLP